MKKGHPNKIPRMQKQLEPRPPRHLIPEEVLVIFALDAKATPVDDDFFDDAFQGLASELPDRIWMGSWKVLRIPEIDVVLSEVDGEEKLHVPGPLLEEFRKWEKAQYERDALRVVRIVQLADIDAYAFVICCDE
jgi:hypothetical protein